MTFEKLWQIDGKFWQENIDEYIKIEILAR